MPSKRKAFTQDGDIQKKKPISLHSSSSDDDRRMGGFDDDSCFPDHKEEELEENPWDSDGDVVMSQPGPNAPFCKSEGSKGKTEGGSLNCPIELSPSPPPMGEVTDQESADDEIEICEGKKPPLSNNVAFGVVAGEKNGGKGKLSPRKQWLADLAECKARWGGNAGAIKQFTPGDEQCEFAVPHPLNAKRSLRLTLMATDPSAYRTPDHQFFCCTDSETTPQIEHAIETLCEMPAGRGSIVDAVAYLATEVAKGTGRETEVDLALRELKLGVPLRVAATLTSKNTLDEEDFEDDNFGDADDDLFGLGTRLAAGPDDATKTAWKRDFVQIIDQGYRVGLARVSELENVIVVSVRVGKLGLGMETLEAWDAKFTRTGDWYLCLLMKIGSHYPLNLDDLTATSAKFALGLSPTYKPSHHAIASAFRQHSSMTSNTPDDFEAFALSKPLAAVMNEIFLEAFKLRREIGEQDVGWAGVELEVLKMRGREGQQSEGGKRVASRSQRNADKEEGKIAKTYAVPGDFMLQEDYKDNLPLAAWGYLLRRFAMCPRFCLICHRPVDAEVLALKPFVCSSKLCLFQFMAIGLGPDVEYEICSNHEAVDLLVQCAFLSAHKGEMSEHPIGLGLRVTSAGADSNNSDVTRDFDTLQPGDRLLALCQLIQKMPAIKDMRSWLIGEGMSKDEQSVGRTRKLKEMNGGTVPNSTWQVLRWVIASNTSYLRLIHSTDEQIRNIPAGWRQFKFTSGAPDKEYKLQQNIREIQKREPIALTYPTLLAFHGSAAGNWHSILREGLHFRKATNGRAYGNGVYFALDGNVSTGTYSQPATAFWENAEFPIMRIAALCAIANSPKEFVSKSPYLVVDQLDWIQARYLLVQSRPPPKPAEKAEVPVASNTIVQPLPRHIVPMDPSFRLSIAHNSIIIPDGGPKLRELENKLRRTPEAPSDISDQAILDFEPPVVRKAHATKEPEWVPAPDLMKFLKLLPPPTNANPAALSTLMREVKGMMKVRNAEGPTERGWYFDPDTTDGNCFQWVVELIFSDKDLPLVQDMQRYGVKSIVMEVRFSENFPFSPPFLRVVQPRFKPFMKGGGGHVTAGGSICMDLLTATGWQASYNMDSVLLQVRMAMSSLDPYPARLDPVQWNKPYGMYEAVEGFRRAAAAHGWQVPDDLEKLTRG